MINKQNVFKQELLWGDMKDNNPRRLVLSLILVIAVLLGIVLYSLVIRPSFTGYVIKIQSEAYDQARTAILKGMITQLQQTGYIQIPIGDEVLRLVPVS